jgi:hypothetical protein
MYISVQRAEPCITRGVKIQGTDFFSMEYLCQISFQIFAGMLILTL